MNPDEQNLDMLVAELDRENRLMRARNERLEHEAEQQNPWVGLTDEERNQLWRDVIKWGDPSHDDVDLMKSIEDKLREKNT
jgi:hypothetical protein